MNYKLLPFEEAGIENHIYSVLIRHPEGYPGMPMKMYTPIEDPDIVRKVLSSCTKYNLSILRLDREEYRPNKGFLSLNQATTFLYRFRYIKKTLVKRQKVVTYEEEVEEEL